MAATAVTPTGVRDGIPDALVGLCDRRGPAVFAYCEVVAGRDSAAPAAADAFESFRAGVVATVDLGTLKPEALLISATRHAAARYAGAEAPTPCASVPGLLAARADRSITLADHDWLVEHLATCWTCRAPVARFKAADRAYREPPATPLAPEVTAAIVAAMTAAAPVRGSAGGRAAVPQGDARGPAPVSTNGGSAHAAHAAPGSAGEHPPVELAPASLDDHGASGLDQPTSAYQIPADELDLPEPPAPARRSRGSRGSARASSLLGALGLAKSSSQPAVNGAAGGSRTTPATATATSAATTASTAEARGARIARRARKPRVAAPAASADASGAASGLPRPRRTVSRTPARGRDRPLLRPAVVLPFALVIIAIIAALAIAGVFGGGEPASVPQSFAPSPTDVPTHTSAAPVVVVPGAATASAASVEKAKARARAAKRRAAEAKAEGTTAATPPPPPAAAADPTPAAANDTPPTPAKRDTGAGSGSGKPKIDAGNGATGAEQLPPAKDTSTVPELAPPVEPAVPPPG